MNARERFLATFRYEKTDRIFYWSFGIREATRKRWEKEGLAAGIDPYEYLELDKYGWTGVISSGPVPAFEPVTIEETERYRIWVDELGATRKDFKDIKFPGFVTRSWLRFPVESRADFLKMQERWKVDSPERIPADWEERRRRFRDRDYPLFLGLNGFFWAIRDWMGFENTCLAFIDKPDLIREMVEFLTDFSVRMLEKVLPGLELDWLIVSEDMAYKHAPMISPQMTRDFFLNGYSRIAEVSRRYGTKVILVDCDGFCNPLIPVWLEAGFDGIYPMEVASGVDVVELRKEYGRRLLMCGNVDKRELAKGAEAIEREVRRKIPFALEGGFIIGPDHAVPYDVSWDNFRYYVDLLRKLGGRE